MQERLSVTVRRHSPTRLRQPRDEHGWTSLLRKGWRRGTRVGLKIWRRITQHRNHVFVYEGKVLTRPALPGFTLLRCTSQREIPSERLVEMRQKVGEQSLQANRWELEHGAVQWIGLIGRRFAGTSMSRRGRCFTKWFVPLQRDDIVIFRNWTAPEHRGKGVCPAIMQRIIVHELANGGKAYVDCPVHNKPSIRSIEKAGFRRFATAKPLGPREGVR